MSPDVDAVLTAYGLNATCTEEDDAVLWAAVLARHWPTPNDPELNVEGLSFGVCDGWASIEQTIDIANATRIWVFERIAPDRLHASLVDELSFPDSLDEMTYPYLTLVLSGPTRGRKEAAVLSAEQFAPLDGYTER